MNIRYKLIPFLFFTILIKPGFGIGTQFLSLPIHARELAMGAHPISGSHVSNPAELSVAGKRPVLHAAYGQWFSDVTQTTVGYYTRSFGGTIGILVRYAGLSTIELRTSTPTDEPLATFGTYGAAFDLSYSKKVRGLKYGITLRHLQMQMHTDYSKGWAVDAGVLYHPWKKLSFGVSVLNLGTMTVLNRESPHLPLRILAGADALFTGEKWSNNVTATMEYSQQVSGLITRIGNELRYKSISLQLGTQLSMEVTTVSGGVNIHVGIYSIGYGFRMGSQGLGSPYMLDVSAQLP